MKLGLDPSTIFDITLVGTGATGSQLLPFLCQLLAHYTGNRIKIIDGDVFEAKNLKNQKCTPGDVGRPKAEILCERYQAVYPELKISYIDQYVKTKEQLLKIAALPTKGTKRIPILISCVDNNASRKVFDEVFYDKDIADLIYIDSGNGTTERIGQVVTGLKLGKTKQLPHPATGDYNAWYMGRADGKALLPPVAEFYPEIRAEQKTVEQTVSCIAESAEAPQNIATNILAATTIFSIVNNIIAFDQLDHNVCYFSAEKPEIISRLRVD